MAVLGKSGALEPMYWKLESMAPIVWLALTALKAGAAYPQWFLLSQCHMEYLKKVRHPVFQCILNDHTVLREDLGEMSMAHLEAMLKIHPQRNRCEVVRNCYLKLGAFRELTDAFKIATDSELNISKNHYNCLQGSRFETIDCLVRYLRGTVLHNLRRNKIQTFYNVRGVTEKKIPGSAKPRMTDFAQAYLNVDNEDHYIRKFDAHIKWLRSEIRDNTAHKVGDVLDELRGQGLVK